MTTGETLKDAEIRHAFDKISRLEEELRREWWLNHGHTGQCGDDGEMQCAMCGTYYGFFDYKRTSFEKLRNLVQFVRLGENG
jgi:hypothetical protein